MPFTTYNELKTVIADYLARGDLTAQIPDFITIFEAQAAEKLHVRPMEAIATLTPSSGSANLPADYLGFRRATASSSPTSPKIEMEYVSPSYLQALYPDGIASTPVYFTIEGSALKTRSSDTNSIEFLYIAKTPALSGALNWLFTNHPNAYLFGSLAEAYTFVQDFQKAALWKARRDEAFEDISKLNFREPGAMAMRPMGSTP